MSACTQKRLCLCHLTSGSSAQAACVHSGTYSCQMQIALKQNGRKCAAILARVHLTVIYSVFIALMYFCSGAPSQHRSHRSTEQCRLNQAICTNEPRPPLRSCMAPVNEDWATLGGSGHAWFRHSRPWKVEQEITGSCACDGLAMSHSPNRTRVTLSCNNISTGMYIVRC